MVCLSLIFLVSFHLKITDYCLYIVGCQHSAFSFQQNQIISMNQPTAESLSLIAPS
jgi:hypothetical protein